MLKLTKHLIISPVNAVIALTCLIKVMARPETCSLGGHVYQVGETWNPDFDNYGKNCITCTCKPGGEPDCVKPDCPKPTCKEPKIIKGQCCPSCKVGPDKPAFPIRKNKGCNYEGENYDHREIFPSNKTYLKPKKDQCVLCQCYNGDVICHLKRCLKTPGCKKLIRPDEDCCFQCALVDTEATPDISDCVTAAGIQPNGTTWIPIVLSLGEIKCVECLCLNGNITCQRLKCPEESRLTCDDPVPDQDGCCRECPGDKKKKKKKKIKMNSNCKNSLTPEEKQKCLSKEAKNASKTLQKQQSQGQKSQLFNDNLKISEIIHKLCVPKSAEQLVYYSKGDNFISLSFDSIKNNTISQTYWKFKSNRLQKVETRIITKPDQFRKNISLQEVLGAIDTKTEKTFWRTLSRSQKRCKKRCRRKLFERAINKFKVMKIDLTKKKCRL